MNTITIISKNICFLCGDLRKFINELPQRYKDNIEILDERTHTLVELHNMLESLHQYSFPTIILKEDGQDVRTITGFTTRTENIIIDHLNKNYAIS
jgi:hypothetical protein